MWAAGTRAFPARLRGAASLAYPRPLVALSTLVGKEARAEEEAAFHVPEVVFPRTVVKR